MRQAKRPAAEFASRAAAGIGDGAHDHPAVALLHRKRAPRISSASRAMASQHAGQEADIDAGASGFSKAPKRLAACMTAGTSSGRGCSR